MKKSVEFTENVLEEKVAKVEQNVCELQGNFKKVEEDPIEQGEKAEVSREQLFVNSYDLKQNF